MNCGVFDVVLQVGVLAIYNFIHFFAPLGCPSLGLLCRDSLVFKVNPTSCAIFLSDQRIAHLFNSCHSFRDKILSDAQFLKCCWLQLNNQIKLLISQAIFFKTSRLKGLPSKNKTQKFHVLLTVHGRFSFSVKVAHSVICSKLAKEQVCSAINNALTTDFLK